MKRSILVLFTFTFLFTACNSNQGVSKVFSKYAHKEGVTAITVPGWVIGLGVLFADLSDEENELLSCIDKVKILSIENETLNRNVNLHKDFFEEINKKNEYEELLSVREENESVTIFGKINDSVIHEMIVLVGGNNNAIIYFEGEIKPELINNTIHLANSELLSMKF